MGTTKEKKIAEQVHRTKNLIKAGRKLRDYRDRIDEIIRIINSGREFNEDIADECIDIGVTIQGLSKLLRPISIEGKEKNRQKKIRARWKLKHAQAIKKDDKGWIKKYSTKHRYVNYGYEGPSESFLQDYCSDI